MLTILPVQIAPIQIFWQSKQSPSWQDSTSHLQQDNGPHQTTNMTKPTDSTRFWLAVRSSPSKASVAFMGCEDGTVSPLCPATAPTDPLQSSLGCVPKDQSCLEAWKSKFDVIQCWFCSVSTTFSMVFWKRSYAEQPQIQYSIYLCDKTSFDSFWRSSKVILTVFFFASSGSKHSFLWSCSIDLHHLLHFCFPHFLGAIQLTLL